MTKQIVIFLGFTLWVCHSPIRAEESPNDDWLISDYLWNIYSLVVDPKAPQIIYAGSGNKGLLKSEDRGVTWRTVFKEGLDAHIRTVVLSPLDSKKIFLGDLNDGLFSTSDGGETWSKIETGLNINFPLALAIQENGLDIYVGTGWGVIRSEDGGVTWKHTSNGLEGETGEYPWVHKIVISPNNSDVIYLLADRSMYHSPETIGKQTSITTLAQPEHVWITHQVRAGIYKSTDRGRTWERIQSTINFEPLRPSDIVFHPTDANMFFVATLQGVYKTRDGGETFQHVLGSDPSYSWCWSLAIDPVEPPQVYAGFGIDGIYRSGIESEEWEQLLTRTYADGFISIFSLIADTNNRGILAGTSQGILFRNPKTSLVSDFDHSGFVDFKDFLLFAQNFGKPFEIHHKKKQFDLNANGRIDFPDFLIFIESYVP